jgi:hypothetical protein
MYEAWKGDICQYISKTTGREALKGQYRLPKSSEFGAVKASDYNTTYNWGAAAGAYEWYKGRNEGNTADAVFKDLTSTVSTNPSLWVAGTYILNYASESGFAIFQGAIFPASGAIGSSNDFVQFGKIGGYWSGSIHDHLVSYSFLMVFTKDYSMPDSSNDISMYSFSVRCIKH